MAIIGSREQMCIHPEVSKKETNFEKVYTIISNTESIIFTLYDGSAGSSV